MIHYYRTIKMDPINVKFNAYIHFSIENDDKDPEFRVGDHVRMSEHRNIFAKVYTPTWNEENFVIKKLKTAFLGHM